MKNVKISVNGNQKLTIEVDLKKDFGISKSGKSKIIATTEGFAWEKDGIGINLNVIKK